MNDTFTFEGRKAETNDNFESSVIDKLEFFMTSPSTRSDECSITRYLKETGEWPAGNVQVTFKNGCAYRYEDIRFETFLTIVEADSPGREFNSELRDLDYFREA
jgi:hypothetical protein